MNSPEHQEPPSRAPEVTADLPARDPTPFDDSSTPADTETFAEPEELPVVPGFPVSHEIARGGMGAVYAARDPVFERDVAVKVMHRGRDAWRFVVESKVTAQLPHPGVPPVHALGTLPDGRPFLAMKRIDGHTLAQELRRADRVAELPRLLGIFERICETVGFAHSKGVVHRDLKPSNVMVGAFGEVLVMDWGLAKVGDRKQETGTSESAEGLAASQGRAPAGDNVTQAGQVKGTPAYMAPEQARGDSVDARADVFALGGILAAVLTGKPPFTGDTVLDTIKQAATGNVHDSFARLDRCEADPELIAIAKRCLAPAAAERFADGTEVAEAIAAYRAGVEERLRTAERERAAAEAKAVEQRKRRKLYLLLAVAAVLLVSGVGAFAWWDERQANKKKLTGERAAADQRKVEARLALEQDFKGRQARVGIIENLALGKDLRKQYKFKAAEAAFTQASRFTESAPELAARVAQARDDLAFVVQLDEIRYGKWMLNTEGSRRGGDFNEKAAPRAYRGAFAARGLDLATLAPPEAARLIAASAVKDDLVAAVDDWALYESDAVLRDRLLTVARLADPGEVTDRIRDAGIWTDAAAVEKLCESAAAVSPAMVGVLAQLVHRNRRRAVTLLSDARDRQPANFELAFLLGLRHGLDARRAIAAYEAARALRPDNASVLNNLGVARMDIGDLREAIAALRQSAEISPDALTYSNLGVALERSGDTAGAIAAFEAAIRINPKDGHPYVNLGIALHRKREFPAAIVAHEKAIECDPLSAAAYTNLGLTLAEQGDLAGAVAGHLTALRIDPAFPEALTNLGTAFLKQGNAAGAIAVYREVIKHSPEFTPAHHNLAVILLQLGKADEAVVAARAAIEIDPKDAESHRNLGIGLYHKDDLDGSIAAYRVALKLDPASEKAHNNLGLALQKKGDIKGAIAAYKLAVKLSDDYAEAHANLGSALQADGDYNGALAAYRAAVKHDPKLARAHLAIGILLINKRDLDGAFTALKTAVAHDPKLGRAHTNLGLIYGFKKNYPEAIRHARKGTEVSPDDGFAFAVLGQLLQSQRDIVSARAAYTEAARLDPRNWGHLVKNLPPPEPAPPPREWKR